jgi:hypothetical protein
MPLFGGMTRVFHNTLSFRSLLLPEIATSVQDTQELLLRVSSRRSGLFFLRVVGGLFE